MPIYLDFAELDRQINELGTIEFKVIEPIAQVFAASAITTMNEAIMLKPEASCQECGNAAATHRWTGLNFLCPGQTGATSPGMELAEQYLRENIDDELRTDPRVQRFIAEMAQALDRGDRPSADRISRAILKEQYNFARARNVIDKRIGLDSYESYMRMRSAAIQGMMPPDYKVTQQQLNDLNNQLAQADGMLSTKAPPDLDAIQDALDYGVVVVDKTRKSLRKPKKPIDAPVLERPKRSYGDDY